MAIFDKSKLTNENLIKILVMILLYVLLGNIKSVVPNLMVLGDVVAVNMIIIVIAGILFGKEVGLIVGLMGTLINAVITGSGFEYAAIIPHLVMGYVAGWLRQKRSIVVSSLSIIVGHALNILALILFGFLAVAILSDNTFWRGLGYEAAFGIVSISIISWLYLKILYYKK